MDVRPAGPDGLTAPELTDATTLLADLVTAGAALGWVDPPTPAEVTTLLRELWTTPPGDAAHPRSQPDSARRAVAER